MRASTKLEQQRTNYINKKAARVRINLSEGHLLAKLSMFDAAAICFVLDLRFASMPLRRCSSFSALLQEMEQEKKREDQQRPCP